ncbi:MAG TPA: putative baseplate assembly protein, partial [Longimicrobium sp.]|nr:putative baseplate assembly protein [Longimicrobium sp.]
MPIRPPALDDRGYEDLVAELLARVPAHTPEWTNPRPGDPGRTLIEMFAWLADTVLYRANLVPERQRLAFLRLLGAPMRPAQAARGLVSLSEPKPTGAVQLRALATLKGAAPFETRGEVTVLPVEAHAFYKRALSEDESREMAPVLEALHGLYGLGDAEEAQGYVTTPLFPEGQPDPAGFDAVERAVDASVWIALLAPEKWTPEQVRKVLGGHQILNVGVAPAVEVPGVTDRIGRQGGVPVTWELTTPRVVNGIPETVQLDVLQDETFEMTRRGVVRLGLPGADDIGAPANDVVADVHAGSRGRPPRLDAPALAARLVCWLRLRPAREAEHLELSWVGVNAVEVDQRQTVFGRIVGESDGTADQAVQLPAASVEAESFVLEVEDPERGFLPWTRVEDLATAGRGDAVYTLDPEAGLLRFGDGLRGLIPRQGMRVRVGMMRSGGGAAGNLPPGSLTRLTGTKQDGDPATINVLQPLAMEGGDDAETLFEAERRIPALLRDRNRAVTPEDYRHLAAEAPGVRAGRVEVLPRFKPHQRRSNVPGVVSVMVLPRKELRQAPNPRPDRPMLERVHAHLDELRPVTTELYVIGVEYVPLG